MQNAHLVVSCRNCHYFQITWNKHSPYGCAFFRFQSRVLPMQAVKQHSSDQCQAFFPKGKKELKKNQG